MTPLIVKQHIVGNPRAVQAAANSQKNSIPASTPEGVWYRSPRSDSGVREVSADKTGYGFSNKVRETKFKIIRIKR